MLVASKAEYFTTMQELHLNDLGTDAFLQEHIYKFSEYLVGAEKPVKITNPREHGGLEFSMDYNGETFLKSCSRYLNFFRSTASLFKHPAHVPEVIICVSHGNSVDATSPMWQSKEDQEKYGVNMWPRRYLCFNIDYCSTTFLKCHTPNDITTSWSVIGDFGTSEHIGLNKAEFITVEVEDY